MAALRRTYTFYEKVRTRASSSFAKQLSLPGNYRCIFDANAAEMTVIHVNSIIFTIAQLLVFFIDHGMTYSNNVLPRRHFCGRTPICDYNYRMEPYGLTLPV